MYAMGAAEEIFTLLSNPEKTAIFNSLQDQRIQGYRNLIVRVQKGPGSSSSKNKQVSDYEKEIQKSLAKKSGTYVASMKDEIVKHIYIEVSSKISVFASLLESVTPAPIVKRHLADSKKNQERKKELLSKKMEAALKDTKPVNVRRDKVYQNLLEQDILYPGLLETKKGKKGKKKGTAADEEAPKFKHLLFSKIEKKIGKMEQRRILGMELVRPFYSKQLIKEILKNDSMMSDGELVVTPGSTSGSIRRGKIVYNKNDIKKGDKTVTFGVIAKKGKGWENLNHTKANKELGYNPHMEYSSISIYSRTKNNGYVHENLEKLGRKKIEDQIIEFLLALTAHAITQFKEMDMDFNGSLKDALKKSGLNRLSDPINIVTAYNSYMSMEGDIVHNIEVLQKKGKRAMQEDPSFVYVRDRDSLYDQLQDKENKKPVLADGKRKQAIYARAVLDEQRNIVSVVFQTADEMASFDMYDYVNGEEDAKKTLLRVIKAGWSWMATVDEERKYKKATEERKADEAKIIKTKALDDCGREKDFDTKGVMKLSEGRDGKKAKTIRVGGVYDIVEQVGEFFYPLGRGKMTAMNKKTGYVDMRLQKHHPYDDDETCMRTHKNNIKYISNRVMAGEVVTIINDEPQKWRAGIILGFDNEKAIVYVGDDEKVKKDLLDYYQTTYSMIDHIQHDVIQRERERIFIDSPEGILMRGERIPQAIKRVMAEETDFELKNRLRAVQPPSFILDKVKKISTEGKKTIAKYTDEEFTRINNAVKGLNVKKSGMSLADLVAKQTAKSSSSEASSEQKVTKKFASKKEWMEYAEEQGIGVALRIDNWRKAVADAGKGKTVTYTVQKNKKEKENNGPVMNIPWDLIKPMKMRDRHVTLKSSGIAGIVYSVNPHNQLAHVSIGTRSRSVPVTEIFPKTTTYKKDGREVVIYEPGWGKSPKDVLKNIQENVSTLLVMGSQEDKGPDGHIGTLQFAEEKALKALEHKAKGTGQGGDYAEEYNLEKEADMETLKKMLLALVDVGTPNESSKSKSKKKTKMTEKEKQEAEEAAKKAEIARIAEQAMEDLLRAADAAPHMKDHKRKSKSKNFQKMSMKDKKATVLTFLTNYENKYSVSKDSMKTLQKLVEGYFARVEGEEGPGLNALLVEAVSSLKMKARAHDDAFWKGFKLTKDENTALFKKEVNGKRVTKDLLLDRHVRSLLSKQYEKEKADGKKVNRHIAVLNHIGKLQGNVLDPIEAQFGDILDAVYSKNDDFHLGLSNLVSAFGTPIGNTSREARRATKIYNYMSQKLKKTKGAGDLRASIYGIFKDGEGLPTSIKMLTEKEISKKNMTVEEKKHAVSILAERKLDRIVDGILTDIISGTIVYIYYIVQPKINKKKAILKKIVTELQERVDESIRSDNMADRVKEVFDIIEKTVTSKRGRHSNEKDGEDYTFNKFYPYKVITAFRANKDAKEDFVPRNIAQGRIYMAQKEAGLLGKTDKKRKIAHQINKFSLFADMNFVPLPDAKKKGADIGFDIHRERFPDYKKDISFSIERISGKPPKITKDPEEFLKLHKKFAKLKKQKGVMDKDVRARNEEIQSKQMGVYQFTGSLVELINTKRAEKDWTIEIDKAELSRVNAELDAEGSKKNQEEIKDLRENIAENTETLVSLQKEANDIKKAVGSQADGYGERYYELKKSIDVKKADIRGLEADIEKNKVFTSRKAKELRKEAAALEKKIAKKKGDMDAMEADINLVLTKVKSEIMKIYPDVFPWLDRTKAAKPKTAAQKKMDKKAAKEAAKAEEKRVAAAKARAKEFTKDLKKAREAFMGRVKETVTEKEREAGVLPSIPGMDKDLFWMVDGKKCTISNSMAVSRVRIGLNV
jgi:hypothetical protein